MERPLSPHRCIIEEDIVLTYVNGPYRLDELKEFLDLTEATYARLGRVYTITMVGPGYSLPPESRSYVAQWARTHPVTATLIVGASFAMRSLIKIVWRATQLIGAPTAPIEFFADEGEARAWIAQHRSRDPGAAR